MPSFPAPLFCRHCQAVVLHQFYLNRHHHHRRIDGHRILMYREKLTAKLEFCTSSGQEVFEADASCLDWRHNASDTRSRFAVSIVVYFFVPLFFWCGGESEGGGFLEFGVNSVFQCIPDFWFLIIIPYTVCRVLLMFNGFVFDGWFVQLLFSSL